MWSFLSRGDPPLKGDRDSRRSNLRKMVNAAWAAIRSTKYDLLELDHRVSLLEKREKADETRARRAAVREAPSIEAAEKKPSEAETFMRLYQENNPYRTG